jgi:hypothetical protein
LQSGPIYTSSEKSALPGAMRDSAPGRWGQQLIKRALRKAGEEPALSEMVNTGIDKPSVFIYYC